MNKFVVRILRGVVRSVHETTWRSPSSVTKLVDGSYNVVVPAHDKEGAKEYAKRKIEKE